MHHTRIHGLDLARALAILGMMTAHLGPHHPWLAALSNGFPSALFAVLAGISLGLMHERADATGGPALTAARHRTLLRGVILVALGMVLATVQSAIAVVLGSIGAIYLALGTCTRWHTGYLVTGAVVLPLLGWGLGLYQPQPELLAQSPLLSGVYPVLDWLAYGLFGMALYRALATGLGARLALTALGLLAGGYAVWQRHLTGELGHGGNPLDVPYSYAVATGVIGLCLLLTGPRAATAVLYPLRSMGTMALTVYVAHVLTAAIPLGGYPDYHAAPQEAVYATSPAKGPAPAGPEPGKPSDLAMPGAPDAISPSAQGHPAWWLGSIVAALALCCLWRARYRRGPLEEALRRATYLGSSPTVGAIA
ncbi:DUF418 domain-containing protein [Corynebacterium sp. zg-331]|uniref:DUF418 domain-containing protein n=1 Tax=unclassified Corynebacterium TaxID=2624378 RepID=UPI00128B567F|nr:MULTISPECIES: DUF418 domain-containing protein [unclassified Corynebacterium]MBC3185091.1 DUF418 domain-containing protein [Corynebacterium sp. zg-331]MPV51590.1 DUF418 domain-containing protein [Corynebacterium sp. zg331]